MAMLIRRWLNYGVLIFVLGSLHLKAATLAAGFTEAQVGSNLGGATTAMAFAPDGRLFVCVKTGQLRVIKNGALLATPFVSLSVDSSGERGLLGVTFDPNFSSNQFLYLYYTTNTSPIHNRISRFTANGDVAASGSEVVLVDLDNLSSAQNHNGGAIHFGPDAKLYAGVGENANSANAQTLNNRLGKVLRYNADGTIPADNPFFNTATGANRSIWALGLRNPFTFAFQPGTGRIFINDVGQDTWEEINEGIAGSNYGWPTCEGACSPTNPNFRDPLFQYGHGTSSTTGCAIVGAAPKKVILRALGPSLQQSGVSDFLADPILELHANDGSLITSNNNWRDNSAADQQDIINNQLALSNDLESAIVRIIQPGTYTAIVKGQNNGTGVGLVEVYDVERTSASRLANISGRALVLAEGNVLISGFIVGNNNGASKLVVRGLGPSLTQSGVTNPLVDPTLELHDNNGALLIANDNWQENPRSAGQISASGLAPSNQLEAAVATSLFPGMYTAIVAGKSGGTGVGVVEVYNLP